MAALIVLERVHTYDEPPDRDVAEYAVIGHEMRLGRHLYTDLWERKPPLLDATFETAERLVGYGFPEIFTLNVVMALATLAGCYVAARCVAGVNAGMVAAGLWVLIGTDPYVEANQPNCEVFVNVFLTAGAALLLANRQCRWRTGLAVGAMFTLATMYEQHMIVTCATLAVGFLLAGGRNDFKNRMVTLTIAAGVGLASWCGLVAFYAAVGRLPAMVDVLFNQLFSQNSLRSNLLAACTPEFLFPSFMAWACGPLALMLLAGISGGARIGSRWMIWIGWAVGTWIVVALPGRFFPHYYQCWIPPFCIAGGWAAGRLVGNNRWPRIMGRLAVAMVLIFVAARELPPYRW
jgi:hypothetical protein